MKICFVASDINQKSGLGRVVTSLAAEFASRGYEVGVVSTQSIPEFDSCVVSMKLSLMRPIKSILDLLRMRFFFRKFDILVAFDPRPAGILMYFASLMLGKKTVIHALGTYALFEERNLLKNCLIALVYKQVTKVFIINSFVQKCIEDSNKNFSFGGNLAYVPVGVNARLFERKIKPSYTYARKYILTVGAVKPRKGQYTSIRAFIKISKLFPDLHYILVGDILSGNDYMRQIYSAIKEANLDDRVHFLQKISDYELMDLYSGAEFFILTPETTKESIEGFGLVYLEAALCGATSIGTRGTGAEDAIEDGKSGLLSSNDIFELSETMRRMLSNLSEREVYIQYAKQRALLYDWTKIVDKYEHHLI